MKWRVGAVLAAVVLVCSASPSFAQDTISGGVKVGVNFGDLDFSSDEPDDEFDDFEEFQDEFSKRLVGLALGGFVNVPFTELVSFQPEFLYVRKGAKVEGDIEDAFGEPLAGQFEQRNTLDQIQVPLLAKVTFPGMVVRPFVVAGPGLGFTVRARDEQDFSGISAELREFLEEEGEIYEDDIKDDVKSLELSLIVGAGVQFGNGSVEARYDHGLTDLNDEEDEEFLEVRSRTFSILFGWSWP